ncbi:TIR domain-containing protein [Actinoplanes derwentensis]|uniref:Predicted nucleotide-binding protein containing TIR-like domain-containing protein n=1 Tax=Actinoplanes derwentensis TaxID=113562 RepID=A0A1H1Y324_9ACTN|nr:TIR domain-containing protein [Actinoplanes derwentensis]GID86742.1 hypothetical protein Ade03nite_56660 [Actinoplanes derwentensis]SDT15793.1 Predicted nucleotide-binding protein containing TIR-like domain-containing protein [Actinoplanes derwentensis]
MTDEPLAEVEVLLVEDDQRGDPASEVSLGTVRFGSWRIQSLPAPEYATDAYLVQVVFDIELAPEVPGPVWAEIGLEFGEGVNVLDVIPRAITREHDDRTYVLGPDLRFTGPGSPDGRSFLLEGLTPTIAAFGLGSRRMRWRHTATTAAGVPVGSHTGWLVVETPPDVREMAVRFSADYRLEPKDTMGLRAGSRPVDRTVALPAPAPGPRAEPDADRSRRVFLIHGRDDVFAGRMRDLLSNLGLRVLEWDPLVRTAGRGASPHVLEVIHHGLNSAQAVVALLTPDDVVSLHPDLWAPREDAHETVPMMQPRPNVLMELGAALLAFRERTVMVKVGEIRPLGDIAGVNYIDFHETDAARGKLVSRLKAAGCTVDDTGTEWRRPARFEGLAVFDRRPPVTGPAGTP